MTPDKIQCEPGKCQFEFAGETTKGMREIIFNGKIHSSGKQQLYVCKNCGKERTSPIPTTSEALNRLIG